MVNKKTATNNANYDVRLLYISLERGTAWFSRTVVRLKDETMLRPNQALPEGGEAMPLADPFGTSSACPEECITRSVILNINERGNVKHGLWWVFVFIIQFIVPITFIFINLIIGMNSFRLEQFENISAAAYLSAILLGGAPIR